MTTKPELTKFVVWAPDYEGASELRSKVRPEHLNKARELIQEGTIRVGGGVLAADSVDPAAPKFFGSCIIIEAESIEVARKVIENDIYYRSGVWDKEKLLILPIMLASPLPPVSA